MIIRTVVLDTVTAAGAREWADVPQEVNHCSPPLACAGVCRPSPSVANRAAVRATEGRVSFRRTKDVIAVFLLSLRK
jgi:hypothetical protein